MIEEVLEQRGKTYGDFRTHSEIAQCIQDAMRVGKSWVGLKPYQKQALTVIADKLARIVNGDPNYVDSWVDIQGYARLVSRTLKPGVPKSPENKLG